MNPELNPFRPFKSLFNVFKVYKIIDNLKPDIVHSHFFTTTLMMRLLVRKSHGIAKLFQVAGPLHLENSITKKVDLISSGNSDYWLATCKMTYNIYEQSGISYKKLALTYLGIDESDYINSKMYNKSNLKNIYGISEKSRVVGMISFFYSPKLYLLQTRGLIGHEDLIDAMTIVKKVIQNVKCVIVGKNWGSSEKYRNKVINYANQKDSDLFIFTGFVKSSPEHYNLFDVAVHPSHSENVGAAVESMYNKVPTVTTNVGGFPDVIIHGKTGLLSDRKNPKKLAKNIIYMLKNPEKAKRMAKNGFVHVRKLLNVKNNAKEVLHLYKKINYNNRLNEKKI